MKSKKQKNSNGMIGGETNELPIMQADISKELYKVFTHVVKKKG